MNTPSSNKPGRPKNPDRHKVDGTYDAKPLDPDYFKRYYQEKTKNKNINCPKCECLVNDSSHMSRHQKTKKCRAKACFINASSCELPSLPDVKASSPLHISLHFPSFALQSA